MARIRNREKHENEAGYSVAMCPLQDKNRLAWRSVKKDQSKDI